jgi:hypothetical protein
MPPPADRIAGWPLTGWSCRSGLTGLLHQKMQATSDDGFRGQWSNQIPDLYSELPFQDGVISG